MTQLNRYGRMSFLGYILICCTVLFFFGKFERWYYEWAENRTNLREGIVELLYQVGDGYIKSAILNLSQMRMIEKFSAAGFDDEIKEYEIAIMSGKWGFRLVDLYHLKAGKKLFRVKNGIVEDAAWFEEQNEEDPLEDENAANEIMKLIRDFQLFGDPRIQTQIQQAYDLRIASHGGRKAS